MRVISAPPSDLHQPSTTESLLLELLDLQAEALRLCEIEPSEVPVGTDPFDALPGRIAFARDAGDPGLVCKLEEGIEVGRAVRRACVATTDEDLAREVEIARGHVSAATARPFEVVSSGTEAR